MKFTEDINIDDKIIQQQRYNERMNKFIEQANNAGKRKREQPKEVQDLKIQKAKEKNTTAKKSGKSRVDNTVKNPNEQPEKKSLEKDLYLGDEVVDLIAKCVKTSVRELEGCLIKLQAVTSILKVDIDLEVAKEHLKLNEELENQKHLTRRN